MCSLFCPLLDCIIKENKEELISHYDLAEELGKTPSNIMRIIKSKKYSYTEEKRKNKKGITIKHRLLTKDIVEQIRNPTRKRRS